jgi:hypothetical protein
MNLSNKTSGIRSLGIGSACMLLLTLTAHAQSTVLPFEPHADFFSAEVHIKDAIDPQVFVKDAASKSGVGPQQITHRAGLRNPRVTESPALPIYNANGAKLPMSLGAWLGPQGEVVLTPREDGKEKVTVILSKLMPDGHYSLFENHFDQKPIGFTPLDGKGTDNNFVADADGRAIVTVLAPAALTHDNAVLVVYHSDGKTHGSARGTIGVDAHHQMIARP